MCGNALNLKKKFTYMFTHNGGKLKFPLLFLKNQDKKSHFKYLLYDVNLGLEHSL